MALLAPRNHAKCQRKGSLVTLSNGLRKKIEDCVIDDKVISLNTHNEFVESKVIDIINNGIRDVFR
ncbi:unnamed protein product, partial [marine sediment metagenome]